MSEVTEGRRGSNKSWQHRASVPLLAAGAGVLPLYSSLIAYQLQREQGLTFQGLIFYLAVICPLSIVILYLLLRFICGESFRDLNLRSSKLSADLVAAMVLIVVIIVANVVSNYALTELIPESVASTSIKTLFVDLASRPVLLVLLVGPLIFLGAASEELTRMFLLSRLWNVWPSAAGKLIAVFVSASLFGLIHIYRGPAHVAWTAIFGVIMALYYLRFGRVVPLILAHYATNAIQVTVVSVMAK